MLGQKRKRMEQGKRNMRGEEVEKEGEWGSSAGERRKEGWRKRRGGGQME